MLCQVLELKGIVMCWLGVSTEKTVDTSFLRVKYFLLCENEMNIKCFEDNRCVTMNNVTRFLALNCLSCVSSSEFLT